jgi:hypothetical protein
MVRRAARGPLIMAVSAATPTDFDISFQGVNPYSARGLRGTLALIDAAKGISLLARTVNGTLIDISAPQMRKYRLEVAGNDQAPPPLDGFHVGTQVTVDSHVEIAYLNGYTIGHAAVPGSERYEGDYIYYRPRFTMMVVEWQIQREEWEQLVSWSLVLEEV